MLLVVLNFVFDTGCVFGVCCQRNTCSNCEPETCETVTEECHSILLLLF